MQCKEVASSFQGKFFAFHSFKLINEKSEKRRTAGEIGHD